VTSKGASSGRPDLPVRVSPATCRARPSAIKRAFRISRHFWRIRKAAGLTGDQAASKRASSGRLDLLLTVLLVLAARARLSTIATKDAHFAFLAIFTPRHAFCRVTSPASLLLLPACWQVAATCCRRLLYLLLLLALRKPGPRSLGFGGHPGEDSEQSVPWPVWSLFGAQIRLVYTWQKSQLE